jgi:hypothetical protein
MGRARDVGLRLTRAEALRGAAAGGVAAGAGALLAQDGDPAVSAAGPSADQDAAILGFLMQLEQIQEAFYQQAGRVRSLDAGLATFVRTVGPQETEHVRFLAKRVGDRARPRLRTNFGDALRSADGVRRAAVDLEELTIAAYVGQGMNLTRRAVADVAGLVSVEARQAAWVRDLAGEVPAPRAADPASTPKQTLDRLRERGYIR